MRNAPLSSGCAALSLVLLAGTAGAQVAADRPVSLPFPLVPVELVGSSALRLDVEPALLGELRDQRAATVSGVLFPEGEDFQEVSLALRRLDVVRPDAQLFVDGDLVGGHAELTAGFSAWIGSVVGEEDSDVYLAITSTGAHGWIRRGDAKATLIAQRNEDGSFEGAGSILVRTDDPAYVAAQVERPFRCEYQRVPADRAPQRGASDARPQGQGTISRSTTSAIEAPVAVESDHAFWQLFNNTTAAQNYALALFGSVSARYLDQINTAITIPYLALYSTPADPWQSPENGGGSVDLLFEFDDYWATSGFPNGAVLGHLISADFLGGGVAYYSGTQAVGLFCDPEFGTAVSSHIHGQTSFPTPLQDDFNWDFIVTAHETGHNWGTTHTHEFCPTPLDQCSPSFGSCQTSQVCQTGTIMSYCHLCPGGIFNSQTQFHPTVQADLTQAAIDANAAGCLPDYPLATTSPRNGTGVNPNGFAETSPPALGTAWTSTVDIALTGHSASILSISSNGPTTIPFGGFGELLILPPVLKPVDFGFGSHSIPLPNDSALLGVPLYVQASAVVPGLRFYNALDICLGH